MADKRDREAPDSLLYNQSAKATAAEIEFVRELGSHCSSGYHIAAKGDRLQLLRSYLKTMDLRADWGAIDADTVRAVVEREITLETAHRLKFRPTNGHGLLGARQYAQAVGRTRKEIRRTPIPRADDVQDPEDAA